MALLEQSPKWQKDIDIFKGIKSTFIIEGNIHDTSIFYGNDEDKAPSFGSLKETVKKIFNSGHTKGFYDIYSCDPIFGFMNENNNIKFLDECSRHTECRLCSSNNPILKLSETIQTALTIGMGGNSNRKSVVVIVDWTSRFLNSADDLSEDEMMFFSNLLHASNNCKQGIYIQNGKNQNQYINTLVLITDKINDIPAWFYLNNPNVRTVTVPDPERNDRKFFINHHFNNFFVSDTTKLEKLTDISDGMKIDELKIIYRLYNTEDMHGKDIADVISTYKFGMKYSPWKEIRQKLYEIEQKRGIVNVLSENIIGQEAAVKKAAVVLERSVTGLSGLQHTSYSKPKGILFLAGPTGTGKTELVKSIARLLFEDERAIIRFDMSEYAEEHADQKLFGAPPGYVGYDSGGQLTNAVRARPFSILLFDEIEKAHPNIMDKFLQVLEDGRMTDGQGNTVYFSETLIIFTSNIGIPTNMSPETKSNVLFQSVWDKMQEKFKPELINRIGKHNIVVFEFIAESVILEIIKKKICDVNKSIYKQMKITLCVHDSVYSELMRVCLNSEVRKMGGRGVINVIEECYVNNLSEMIFKNNILSNKVINARFENGKYLFIVQ